MIANYQNKVQTKLTKGLLDMIILEFLGQESMYGYQIITKIRKTFGISFGPSTIYPLLGQLEKKGYVKSAWNTEYERPRKIYTLTSDGKSMLNYSESSLNFICKNLSTDSRNQTQGIALMATA